MKAHEIDLTSFRIKGHVTCEYKDDALQITTLRSIPTQRFDLEHLAIHSFGYLPNRYHLPFRIDLTAKIDAPGLYVLPGNGHINFGTMWQDNRRMDDIAAPARKIMLFHNHIEMNTWTDLSILYDKKEMQILINGEERYYSTRERYMKPALLDEINTDGLMLKIACDKLTTLHISALRITEYETSCGIVRPASQLPAAPTRHTGVPFGERASFEQCIAALPVSMQNAIIQMDRYLKDQRKIKFKRQIEKNGNKITYVASEQGFSYTIYVSNDLFDHSLQWYLITSGKPETWHRKADRMEAALRLLEPEHMEYAKRMFQNLDDCVGCYQNCLARTLYQFGDQQKYTCHGKLKFKMHVTGFEDARIFIDTIIQMEQAQLQL